MSRPSDSSTSRRTKSFASSSLRAPAAIADRCPSLSDHDEHRSGFAQRRLQDADEVGARIDRVDVQEHLASAEAPVHVIGETTGLARRILSSVADEDPWWHSGDQLIGSESTGEYKCGRNPRGIGCC